MRLHRTTSILLALALVTACTAQSYAGHRVYSPTGLEQYQPAPEIPYKPSSEYNGPEKAFSELTKDKVEIPGLFTFYQDTATGTVYMAIKPDQFGKIYLCGTTLSKADGAFFDNGAMEDTYPFYFKRVGKKIFLLEKNLRLRADSTATLRRAVEGGISDHLIASFKVESRPDSAGAILIDPASYFLRDAENVGFFLGQMGQTSLSFDRDNSYYETIKGFPENCEIDMKLHFRTSKPQVAVTLQNGTSLFHTYHYSLSAIPQSDYRPRIADDRVGNFLTMYEDYSTLDKETPYVRYINRWNLKKKDTTAAVSEPVKPIVYWIENTVPLEYRDAVKKGIEFWQPAFEKAGFKNAIIAKQMPDTASWDPADVRYNTVRWIVIPGGTYAVGPSRANPLTGEIYDADIRVAADFIRAMYNTMQNWIAPVAFNGMVMEENSPLAGAIEQMHKQSPYACDYEAQSATEAAFGLAYLESSGDFTNKDSLTKVYVNQYITELVAHEVGHTLGLRHNFKASTVYSLDQLADEQFTSTHGTGGTVMDYTPPNIGGLGRAQGEFYMTTPGPYDYWAIEYAYKDFGAKTPEEELPELKKIADRSSEPELAYATDEDAFGSSPKSVDPYCNLFDQGNDPLKYAEFKIRLTRQLWGNAISHFEVAGNRYQKIMGVFQSGWRSYNESVQLAPKYVGGLIHNRAHVGDPGGKMPFEPVSAADQRRAMAFLRDYVFAADAFDLPADLLNKLQPEDFPDFAYSNFSVAQVDYPFHQMVLYVQKQALDKLYHPLTVGRLLNNAGRIADVKNRYTMYDMFTDMRKMIWSEAATLKSVNSFRRQLQLAHLQKIIDIYLSAPAIYPTDARTLAANDLDIIERAARTASVSPAVDNMSQAHFKEVLRQIAAAKKAQRDYSSPYQMTFGG